MALYSRQQLRAYCRRVGKSRAARAVLSRLRRRYNCARLLDYIERDLEYLDDFARKRGLAVPKTAKVTATQIEEMRVRVIEGPRAMRRSRGPVPGAKPGANRP